MQAIQYLSVILLFIIIHVVVLYAVAYAISDGVTQTSTAAHGFDELRYQGVLYIGDNDKPVDCYRHCATNAVYYKQGTQYRSAISGRIVSSNAALSGTY